MARPTRRTPTPTDRLERPYWSAGVVVGGIDEVGRGAGAGPVVHGCVILNPDGPIPAVRDSKTLTALSRQRLAQEIDTHALSVGIGQAEAGEVDSIGLSKALTASAQRAIGQAQERLGRQIDVLLMDGNWNFCPQFPGEVVLVTRGDRESVSIAAASILAKVYRDQLMVDLDPIYPGYGLAANKGYLTASHLDAIRDLGPSPIHRMTWAPIREFPLF